MICLIVIFHLLFYRVHDDVQLCQWLRNPQGKLKLGDFNRAEIPNFNPVTGQYCRWNNGRGNGNYRAPEEFDAKDLDEQIDVFTFGNNIYALVSYSPILHGEMNCSKV